MKKQYYFAALILAAVSTGCVSKKKFIASETGRAQALTREAVLRDDLAALQDKSDKQSIQIDALLRDTTETGKTLRDFRQLLYSNVSEQEKLSVMLREKMDALQEREATINELRAVIDNQNAQVRQLLGNVKDALMGFSSDELSVTQKGGKVYVALSDKLLFESGSARVDIRGKEALGKLAEVLKRQQDIDVFIEGHTDSIPIHTAQFKDNWDLSVLRATSVVRILTADYGVNPIQIQPSGRGEFLPVDNNKTPEGRARNRRTEIIMAPKLDKLLQLLQ